MTKTRKIVCATDFSDNAKGAADVAAAIASKLATELVLIHVADQAHAYTQGTKAFRAFLRPITSRLRNEARRLRRKGAMVKEVLLHGKLADTAVVDYLQDEQHALVVVSSVSKTVFDRWTIGSVSERISQSSPAPTLVVRSPQRLLAWATEQRQLKVLVAADFTVSSDAAIAWVCELGSIGPCAVTVAHINWPPDEYRVHQSMAESSKATLPSVRRQVRRDLQRKAADIFEGSVEVQVEPNWGRPDAALVHLAAEADADLVVVGTHQWHGLQRLAHVSISRGVLRHAPMSVACVPVTAEVAHGAGQRHDLNRVLVATDFSDTGDRAVPWAYATLAAGGTVKLIHVLAPERQLSARANHQRIVAARDKLTALMPQQVAKARIETEVEVMVAADPAVAISEAARVFAPDIICLGSKAHTLVGEALLGSVTRAVMEKNRQPVLLVRPPPA